jgi:hypothetical protein
MLLVLGGEFMLIGRESDTNHLFSKRFHGIFNASTIAVKRIKAFINKKLYKKLEHISREVYNLNSAHRKWKYAFAKQ